MVLLRIDVYPYNATVKDEQADKSGDNGGDWKLPQSPIEPLYACLASAAIASSSSLSSSSSSAPDGSTGHSGDSTNGAIIQVGRKDADVVFKDKSVSRRHLRLRIISQNANHQSKLTKIPETTTEGNNTECESGSGSTLATAAASPQSPEEIQACQSSNDGMCVVLTDMGAKFGTYLVVDKKEEIVAKQPTSSDTNDDDETGDETGDESTNVNKGTPLSSMTSKVVANPSAKVLKQLEANSSIVLKELSENAINSNETQVAVVQCGSNGSTIVITRVPMRFAFSRVDPTEKELCQTQMYAIGASCTDNLDQMTHLITKDKISAPKALIAWCRNIPLVTTQYVRQLLERTSPQDPMPNPSDTIQEGKDPFWKKTPNPKLWSNCTLLVVTENDMVSVIRAAGATVIEDLESHKRLSDNKFDELLSKIVKEHSGCFYIETPSKRKVSRSKLSLLKKRGIPCVTSKHVAKLVTAQKPLVDAKGNAIGGQQSRILPSSTAYAGTQVDSGHTMEGSSTNDKNNVEEPTQQQHGHHGEGVTQLESQALFSSNTQQLHSEESTQNVCTTEHKIDANVKESVSSSQSQRNPLDETSQTTKRSRKDPSRTKRQEKQETQGENYDSNKDEQPSKRQKEDVVEGEVEQPPSKSVRSKRNRTREAVEQERGSQDHKDERKEGAVGLPNEKERHSKRKKLQTVVEDIDDSVETMPQDTNEVGEIMPQETSKAKRGRNTKDTDSTGGEQLKSKRVRREKTNTTRQRGERKKLKTSTDGWLVAAPPGAKRSQYRRTETELKEKYEEYGILPGEEGYDLFSSTAETDVCDNLVISKAAQRQTSTLSRRCGRSFGSTRRSAVGGIGHGVTDFKKFRKNHVIDVPSVRTSRIKLFSVLPKESERQKELFEQERRLQEEKKIADSLFRDPGAGMKSFFQQGGRKRRARV